MGRPEGNSRSMSVPCPHAVGMVPAPGALSRPHSALRDWQGSSGDAGGHRRTGGHTEGTSPQGMCPVTRVEMVTAKQEPTSHSRPLLREGDTQPEGDSSHTLPFFPFYYFYPCQIENKASTKGTQPTSLQSDALGRNLCRIHTP